MAARDIAIRVEGLTRHFGSLRAVDGIDLAVPRGRIFGFLGPNGSGKTTTIRMMCGLLQPTAGTVSVLGLTIPDEAEALRLKAGYMTQKFSLYDDLTVRENLDFVAQIFGLSATDAVARIAELTKLYWFEKVLDQRAGTMSGGQRQRLALAAATLHRPELLFLDEPTAGVDPQSRRDFWDSLFTLAHDGTTILVSTHYMDEAERCHGLAILDQGQLVAEGAPRDLVAAIDAHVLDIAGDDLEAVKRALADLSDVMSAAELAGRLRVLLRGNAADPEALIVRQLDANNLQAEVTLTDANLEDVFVTATLRAKAARERTRDAA